MSVYRPKGSDIYVYDFQHRTARFCGSTGATSKREALAVEKQCRAEAEKEIAGRVAAGCAPMTVGVAMARYWTEIGQHHKGSDNTWWSIDWLEREIGGRRLILDITDNDVAKLVAKRRAEAKAPATVNRSMTEVLRKVLRRAKEVWDQDVAKIQWREHMLAEPKERVRELRGDEETRLFAELRPDYHGIVRFALLAGCRLAECVGLRWSDVDWGGRVIWITGKGGKRAPIPLSPSLRTLLWPLQVHHPEMVFTYVAERGRQKIRKGSRQPITREGLKSMWRRRKVDAGLTDYRFHDNRHTTATRLLRSGGNLKAVQRLLRHESIETTMRYAHVTDEDLMKLMEASATQNPVESTVTASDDDKKHKA